MLDRIPDLDNDVAKYYELDITSHENLINSFKKQGTNHKYHDVLASRLENIKLLSKIDLMDYFYFIKFYFASYYKLLYFENYNFDLKTRRTGSIMNIIVLKLFTALRNLMDENHDITERIYFEEHKS